MPDCARFLPLALLAGLILPRIVHPFPAINNNPVSADFPTVNGEVLAVCVVEHPVGGVVYIGGHFTEAGGQPRHHAAAFDLATGKLLPWDPHADGAVFAIATSGNTVFLGGEFSTVDGGNRNRLAAVDAASGAALPWNPDADGAVRALAVASGVVYVGGDFQMLGGENRNHLAAFRLSDLSLLPWNPSADGRVLALKTGNGRLFAGGEFQTLFGTARPFAAAFDLATGPLLDWNPKPDGAVRAFALDGSRLFLGGDFTTISGTSRGFVAAVHADSGDLLEWNAQVDGTVRSMDTIFHILYLAGDFTHAKGADRPHIAALETKTSGLLPWNPTIGTPINAIRIAGFSNDTGYWPTTKDMAVLVGGGFPAGFTGHRDPLLFTRPDARFVKIGGRRGGTGFYTTKRRHLRVTGVARGNPGLDHVLIRRKREKIVARGTTRWTAVVRLKIGRNDLQAHAIDSLGRDDLHDEPFYPEYVSIRRLRPREEPPKGPWWEPLAR